MNVYTYSEARQRLAALLDKALKEGEVRIRRKDGQVFVLRPQTRSMSPLDTDGLDLGLSREEIVEFVREGRREYDAGP
jgi:PHD/YefM family antitoxin component YafN of YafNO toxin-antitoxin module